MMRNSLFWRVWTLLLALSGLMVLAYSFAGAGLVADAYHGASLPLLNRMFAHASGHPEAFYVHRVNYLVSLFAALWLGLLFTVGLAATRLQATGARGWRIPDWVVTALYAALFGLFLVSFGSEQEWYVLSKVMSFSEGPPFQHRIMFVLPALALRALVPGMSYLDSFLWSQCLAIFLALWAVRRLAAQFIREDLAFVAQFLFFAMWAPTLSYFTFYDIGIVFVFSFCLYHLLRREIVPYLLMFALGTVNHETTLFLVVASAVVLFGQMNWRTLLGLLVLQLALYAMVRLALFHFMPTQDAWQGGKVAKNIALLLERPRDALLNLGPLVIAYAVAALGWRHAPADLRRCLIILPCLMAMTFLVGQLNEGRQFDAFIPVAVALMVCGIAARLPASARAGGARLAGRDTGHAGRPTGARQA